MGLEIERKFLVDGDAYQALAEGIHVQQGYLEGSENTSVRIRIMGEEAFLAIKGTTISATRQEFEYPIPLDDAREMMRDLCKKPIIDKHRYIIKYKGSVWEVDEFHGMNEGLVIAEIELESEEQKIHKPDWIGDEVTDEPKYFNVNLVKHPFISW